MAKHTFKIGSQAADAEPGGGGFYDGEKPPQGVYQVELKFMRLKTNKNGDDMLNVLMEVAEPKGDKAKFNGYGIWDNLNVTDEGAGYINALLDVMGIQRKSFWPPNGPLIDNNDPPNVTKIGTKRPEGCKFRVATKDEEYRGTEKLGVTRYLPLKASADEEEPEEDETEVDEAEVDEEETEDGEEEESSEDEQLTAEELGEYDIDDLKAICDSWEIKYTAKATEKTLIKKILEAQEAAAGAEDEEAEEEEADEEEADEEEEVGYTEEDLKGESLDRLKEILKDEFEKPLPKPPIKPRLIKAILAAQEALSGEPPF